MSNPIPTSIRIGHSRIHGLGLFASRIFKTRDILFVMTVFERGPYIAYLNHSDDPNSELHTIARVGYAVVAIRRIQKGEEITGDYNRRG